MKYSKTLTVPFMLVFCSACASKIEAEVGNLTFLSEPTVISGYSDANDFGGALGGDGSAIQLQGWIRGVVSTDVEVISLITSNGHKQTAQLTYCSDGREVAMWSPIYKIENSTENQYYFVFRYKSRSNDQFQFNLLEEPGQLCLQIAAAEMNPLSSIVSNKAEFNLSKELLTEVEKYDQQIGVISGVKYLPND